MNATVRFAAVLAAGFAIHISALHAASEGVVYSFGQNAGDGVYPAGGLINVGGTLYGTTTDGGAYGGGTVFSIDPTSGAETVLYSFGASTGDGRDPSARLTKFKNLLYGTTEGGGDHDKGAVFSFDPATAAEAVLYSFGSHKDGKHGDGAYPRASLVAAGDKLYGTTQFGGTGGNCSGGCGTVFSIKPTTGCETVLYSFQNDGIDGVGPLASLVDVGGILYGTTVSGGTGTCDTRDGGCGTVFSVDPTIGVETVLHSFQNGSDGANPYAGVTNFNGLLYGTTGNGGGSVNGTVFSIDPSTGEETVVHSFNYQDGQSPVANVITVGHTLYGTTYYGGKQRVGVVFAFKPATGIEKVLHSFSCCHGNDGADPWAPLVAVNGALYGTTLSGGSAAECGKTGCGTVFAVQLH